MMKQILTILSVFSVLLFIACKKEVAQPTQTIVEGTVIFSKTNQPAFDATVYIRGFKNSDPEPPYFHDNTTNYLVTQTKTDWQGKYKVSFVASPDSTYRIVLKSKDTFHIPNLVRPVKPNVSQTVDYGYCKAAYTRLLYFNDKSMRTDSVNLVISRYLPCETETIYAYDDSKFTNASLLTSSSLSEPNSAGVSNTGFFALTEDNTVSTVKYVRYVNGAAVQTRVKTLKPRIGNDFNLDTIHIVW